MVTLKDNQIQLRPLEPEDLNLLYTIENDESVWEVSDTQTPYSRSVLKKYLDNAHLDIYETKQLRLVITTSHNQPVGLIDLYDFNPRHKRVGVGVLIIKNEQNKGFAKAAIQLVDNFTSSHLQVHQLYATIACTNSASISLFESLGFHKTGVRKDWNFYNSRFIDEYLYQKIHVH
ncbi:GNAT family N-acetyltransferase [Aquimarina sp. ERC-38]|uniref:GNAT family N-acetyltransferase n=1 Tax=Aquimarina sp. ERC-38 TaxID=2949996 RepID=UPI00224774C4|nr:GNAT family N-acetyltransferase [Aquimarina sp. ERC-38]UZO79348.1 GNAT family N-acetyltransferase [Aquimarina sp. ERC-38]